METPYAAQRLDPGAQALIRERVLLGARDPSQALRHTAGSVVTTIVSTTRLSQWPELLPALVAMLESGDAGLGDGALNALLKVRLFFVSRWGGRLKNVSRFIGGRRSLT